MASTTWRRRPKRRGPRHLNVLALSSAGLVLTVAVVVAFGMHHAKFGGAPRLVLGGHIDDETDNSAQVLSQLAKSANQRPTRKKPIDTGKPTQKSADTPTPASIDVTPAPAPPSDSAPESFDILGPTTLSLGLDETVSVSFATNDASSVVWSGTGPEQNEIGANFSSITGQSYTVSFTATDQAKVDTQVAFSIHVSDPNRGIETDKTIIVTVTK